MGLRNRSPTWVGAQLRQERKTPARNNGVWGTVIWKDGAQWLMPAD